jgi:hypothetical protein
MMLEVAAGDGLIKQGSQKLKEKRCGDCRDGKSGPQGNWSENLSAAFKSGIEISVWREFEERRIALWNAGITEHGIN